MNSASFQEGNLRPSPSVEFLEMLPLSNIARYSRGQPKDGLPFTGYPRQHPSEKNKIILVSDPLGPGPTVLEFKLEDVLFIEEIPSAVTEAGEGIPMIKLWIRKGAHGMIIEPFEVNEPVQFAARVRDIRERFLQNQPKDGL
jgi:hypothetical protein